MLALYIEWDKDTRISIERGREEVDHFITNVVSKFSLVGLFLLGHKLVYSAGKSMYNSVL